MESPDRPAALPAVLAERVDRRYANGVGQGWWPILEELHEQLLAIDPAYQLARVREKYASLRVDEAGQMLTRWNEGQRQAFETAATAAEDRSLVTCEECGRPGSERNLSGWFSTLCDACFAARQSGHHDETARGGGVS